MKKKVFLGMSGGVDSSVAAHLLKKDGFEVIGVFFKNIPDVLDSSKYQDIEEEFAREVAKALDIKFLVCSLEKTFTELIINPFISKYSTGKTPNPCINCNRDFKFGVFANECFKNGAQYIATGHYAKTKDGRLYKGRDREKDQSYFLNQLSSEILEKTLFPLGDMKKVNVRKIASKLDLPSKEKRDSQKICFTKGGDLKTFLGRYIKPKIGDIVDIDSEEIVGKHEGIFNYTLGQRKGIEIGGLSDPYFVCGRDIEKDILFVAKGRENDALWKKKFFVKNFNIINKKNIGVDRGLKAVIRYHSQEIPTTVEWLNNGSARFELDREVWLPSEGQSLVVYKGRECIGGGEIEEIE